MSCLQALLILTLFLGINSIPPEACFAKFRWDDCGRPPVDVLYYWKPRSKCEVGVWRGCLPNLNMFKDEYECVATCIFTSRAKSEDYHVLNAAEYIANVTEYMNTNETFTTDTLTTGTFANDTSVNDTTVDSTMTKVTVDSSNLTTSSDGNNTSVTVTGLPDATKSNDTTVPSNSSAEAQTVTNAPATEAASIPAA